MVADRTCMVFSADLLPPSDPDPDEGEQWTDAASGIPYIRSADGLWIEGGAAPGIFPATPLVGDIATYGERRWRWNGVGWQLVPTHAEAESRTSTLESGLAAEIAARAAALTSTNASLATEISNRIAADAALQTSINANMSSNTTAIGTNTTNIASNTAAIAALRGPVPVVIADAASTTFDATSGGTRRARLTATGNRTLTAPLNPVDGQQVVIEHLASGAAFTLTLTTGSAGAFRFGVAPTTLAQTGSGRTDYVTVVYNGPAQRWDVLAVQVGY